MRRFRLLVLLVASLFFCSIASGCTSSSNAAASPELEQQVLQIIRDNPEVVLEVVELAAKERQEQSIREARQGFLAQMIADPSSVIGNSPTTGSPEQKIVLLEFSDFQCPFCARAHQTVKQFMEKHGDSVTLAYKHLPLTSIHPQALPAAKAAWAAGRQGKFWEYHNALFEQQAMLGEELYNKIARDLDLNVEKFNSDRQSDAAIEALQEDIQVARSLRINGTPFFLLNGEALSGAIELSQMEEVLQKVLQSNDE